MANKTAAIVGGVGLGAALMYFFDPDRGKRRRALVRDKIEAAGNQATCYAGKMGRDLRNRAYGVVAETKSLFQRDEATDEVIADRVRAKLGRYQLHLGSLDVQATEGTVVLSGSILADELAKVLRAAKFVRGVKRVENQLLVFANAGKGQTVERQRAQ